MKRLAGIFALKEAIGHVKRDGPGYAANFFAQPAHVEAWCAAGTLETLPCERALLILRRDGELTRVHHVASDLVALSAALGVLTGAASSRTLIADLVGKPPDIKVVAGIYMGHGFVPHARLVRMQLIGVPRVAAHGATDVEPARLDDVPLLQACMERWLDPLSEQIQNARQLGEAVAADSVLVVRDGQGLAGFLIYDTIGQSTILRYWHVDGRCHNRGIGSRLMRALFARCPSSRRISLWVIAGNADAVAKYQHYGFREDGLADQIMVRQPEQATG